MKYIIEDLESISDSDVVKMHKPPKFTVIVITLMLIIIFLTLIWSIFSTKEITTSIDGVINLSEDKNEIPIKTNGIVKTVDFKDGDSVKEGDILLTLENEELISEKEYLEHKIKQYKNQLDSEEKLRNSINDGKNYLSNNEVEQNNYNKYKEYTLELSNSEVNSIRNEKEIQKREQTKAELCLFKESVISEKNLLKKDSEFYYEYIGFELELNRMKDEITALKNKEVSKNEIYNKEMDLEVYKNNSIISIDKQIKEIEKLLNSDLTIQDSNMIKNKYSSEIEKNIDLIKNQLEELEHNLDLLNIQIEKNIVKATDDGILSTVNTFNIGDFVTEGVKVGSITSDSNEYKVDLLIPNYNIGQVKVDQDVKVEVISLPSSEYGFINGKIESIGTESITIEGSSITYYKAQASMDKIELVNEKNEVEQLKNHMQVEVKVISRKVSYLRYWLESINFI